MKYLKTYESLGRSYSLKEIEDIFRLNLEEYDFDIDNIIVDKIHSSPYFLKFKISIDEDFEESNIPEIINYRKDFQILNDKREKDDILLADLIHHKTASSIIMKSIKHNYDTWLVLSKQRSDFIKEYNKNILIRICRKYDFERSDSFSIKDILGFLNVSLIEEYDDAAIKYGHTKVRITFTISGEMEPGPSAEDIHK